MDSPVFVFRVDSMSACLRRRSRNPLRNGFGVPSARMDRDDRVRAGLLILSAALVVALLLNSALRPVAGMELGRSWALGFAAFPVAAALLLVKRPGNVIGRLLGLVGVAGAATFGLIWFAVTAAPHQLSAVAEALSGVTGTVMFSSVIALLLLFPTGRPLPGAHTRVFVVFVGWAGVWAVASTVWPGPMPVTGRLNPLGGPGWLEPVLEVGQFAFPVFVALAIWTLLARMHRGGPVERAQLRWLFTTVALLLAMGIVTEIVGQDAVGPIQTVTGVLIVAAFWSMPAAIVVAITRYHLYEIDRIVSRTASYTVVAGILAIVYLGSIISLQALLPVGGSDLAVAASTLASAALFAPVRRRVQKIVDRRFDRARYEADRVIREFSEGLRREVDLDALTAGLIDVAVRTMRPVSAQLWVGAPGPATGHHAVAEPTR
jgi:hypothetical protein